MRIGLQDTNWEYIGAKLAQADNKEQTTFFKAFIKECKSWGTNFQVEEQLFSINKSMKKDERELLSMLSFMED